MDQARYTTYIVAKYLDTATVKVSTKFYKTTLTADIIFTKEYVSTSDEQVEKLTMEFNIHYRSWIGSLIYLLSTRADLSFSVHKLEKFSANPGKLHFEGLVHLLRYITSIKNENHLMAFSYSIWQDCPDTGRSTGAYMIFYQCGPIDHGTHVPGPVSQ